MDRKVIGTGGFGCVISPALVFSDSTVVTSENAGNYVTKLASDAQDEYDIGTAVVSKVGKDVGIFPVDVLHCGVTWKDLGPKGEEIVSSCKYAEKHIRNQLGEKTAYTNFKDFGSKKIGGDVKPWDLKDSQRNILCAVQYPRFLSDLNGWKPETPEIFYNGVVQLYTKLQKLHDANIAHLDIKPENIALVDSNPATLNLAFFDWGYAEFLPTAESVKILQDFIKKTESFDTQLREKTYEFYVMNENAEPDRYKELDKQYEELSDEIKKNSDESLKIMYDEENYTKFKELRNEINNLVNKRKLIKNEQSLLGRNKNPVKHDQLKREIEDLTKKIEQIKEDSWHGVKVLTDVSKDASLKGFGTILDAGTYVRYNRNPAGGTFVDKARLDALENELRSYNDISIRGNPYKEKEDIENANKISNVIKRIDDLLFEMGMERLSFMLYKKKFSEATGKPFPSTQVASSRRRRKTRVTKRKKRNITKRRRRT